ncbi:MAG: hydroxymethylbilane synthase [Capnocytophaga sp.]|nr:hydroxymethylbilane synthase [Capnocytophaga sp.]
MEKIIKIGTRDSELALWQAYCVKNKLEKLGYKTEIISVKSQGDIILDKPLYEMGITGVFTRTLDIAMLQGEIDIAVHSMKDVPTSLPKGIVQGAVLERANVKDILIYKENLDFLTQKEAVIATGSLRRKAQWLHKYPSHTVENLRGNVNTRLQKLNDNSWNGAIFASAGLERINKLPDNHYVLDWMTPAPAQGAILVVAMENDNLTREILTKINHTSTEICVDIERRFLRKLEGGCTAPIGAFAEIQGDTISFTGNLFSVCGTQKIEISKKVPIQSIQKFPEECAEYILNNGGKEILETIKNI